MKKIVICQIALSFVLMNCQGKGTEKSVSQAEKTSVTSKPVNQTQGKMDFKDLKFGTNGEELLKGIGLTVNDNASGDFNTSVDYVEFQFPKDKNLNLSLFNNTLQSATDEVSVFYSKNDKKVWCYEMVLQNNPNTDAILSAIEKKAGHKADFSDKKVNTKERPIFLNENGEFKTDHIEETIQVWEDKEAKTTFFTIHTVNLSKKPNENTLKIFALDKTSPKYKEWVSYRSLDMFYNK